jgi:hypothetical protein
VLCDDNSLPSIVSLRHSEYQCAINQCVVSIGNTQYSYILNARLVLNNWVYRELKSSLILWCRGCDGLACLRRRYTMSKAGLTVAMQGSFDLSRGSGVGKYKQLHKIAAQAERRYISVLGVHAIRLNGAM